MNPDADPREAYGVQEIVEEVKPTFRLVPSRPTTPDTGGSLDYGIACVAADGRAVLIGELFAAAIWMDSPSRRGPRRGSDAKIRIHTGKIGDKICDVLNAHWSEGTA